MEHRHLSNGITLSSILSLVGYHDHAEQIAYAKLLAFKGCFQALQWCHAFVNTIITDNDAHYLLSIPFNTFDEGYFWLLQQVDDHLLRKTFQFEHAKNESDAINTKRWDLDEKPVETILEQPQSVTHQIYNFAKQLHFIRDSKSMDVESTQNCVLVSSIGPILHERISYLAPFKGTLYFLGGTRGVFNDEQGLAAILAEWFLMPEKKDRIANILSQHSPRYDTLQWTQNLVGLKEKIVKAISAPAWPKAPQSYYYQHQELYDLSAHMTGKQSLNCLDGPWPVAADLALYYIKKRFKGYVPFKFITVVALGREQRIVTLADMVEVWMRDYGKALVEEGKKITFILDNRTFILPFAYNYFLSNEIFQDSASKKKLKETLESIIEHQPVLKRPSLEFCAPPSPYFNETGFFDAIAKTIFPFKINIACHIDRYKNVHGVDYPGRFVKEIIHYHHFRHYIQLIAASSELAHYFIMEYLRKNQIKASGLLNFSRNVLKRIDSNERKGLSELLRLATLSNIQEFIRKIKPELSECSIINKLSQLDKTNKQRLKSIRAHILKVTNQQPSNYDYSLSSKEMKRFFYQIVHQSCRLLELDINQFSFIYLGSNARKECTPYSDTEFFIIISDKYSGFNQAKALTKLSLLIILNLKETIIPTLNILVENKSGQVFNFQDLYDNYSKEGFCFDGYQPKACKTPLGKKIASTVRFRLIGTPKNLIEQLISQTGFNYDFYLPQLLHLSSFMCGNKNLYIDFIERLKENSAFNLIAYSKALLQYDLRQYYSYLIEIPSLPQVNHRKYVYRPLMILIDDLFIALGFVQNIPTLNKIQLLVQYRLINETIASVMRQNYSFQMETRLKQHFKHGEQRLFFSPTDDIDAYNHFVSMQTNLTNKVYRPIMDSINYAESKALLQEHQLAKTHCRFFQSAHKTSCTHQVSQYKF